MFTVYINVQETQVATIIDIPMKHLTTTGSDKNFDRLRSSPGIIPNIVNRTPFTTYRQLE